MQAELIIKDLHVSVDNKEILKGVNLEVKKGEVVALMGPNGSGKSTLTNAIIGHPKYKVTKGQIIFRGEDITNMKTDERARKGLFISFQHPEEIPGVTVQNFLKAALSAVKGQKISILDFSKTLKEKMQLLEMDSSFANRYLNEGFSGGEKKRTEVLQLAVLEPLIAILDETDSGTDVDALRIIANGINKVKDKSGLGILLITHYQRILNYIKPERVYIMKNGKIIKEGSAKLVEQIEREGYDKP